jgi:hypothetical protein
VTDTSIYYRDARDNKGGGIEETEKRGAGRGREIIQSGGESVEKEASQTG